MEEFQRKTNEIIFEVLQDRITYEEVTPEKLIVDDLQAESVDILEIILALVLEFNVTLETRDAVNLKSINDIYLYIQKHAQIEEDSDNIKIADTGG